MENATAVQRSVGSGECFCCAVKRSEWRMLLLCCMENGECYRSAAWRVENVAAVHSTSGPSLISGDERHTGLHLRYSAQQKFLVITEWHACGGVLECTP